MSCVSRLVEYKRVEDLILAMDILINQNGSKYKDLKVKIVGTGPEEEKLIDLVKEKKFV
nr:glycosyltransferase [Methanobrevibacter arboriphilus]